MSTRLLYLAAPLALVLAPAVLVAEPPVLVAEPPVSPSEAPAALTEAAKAVEAPAAALGVTVFVDPETGQLTDQPTPEQEAWLRTEFQRRGKTSHTVDGFQPRPVPLIDGGEGLALQDFVVSSTFVVPHPSGGWTMACHRDGLPHTHLDGAHDSSDPSADSSDPSADSPDPSADSSDPSADPTATAHNAAPLM